MLAIGYNIAQPIVYGVSALQTGLSWLWNRMSIDLVRDPGLSVLLRSHRWIYNPGGLATKLHFLAVKVLSTGRNKLFDYQKNLPSLPIPPLQQSIRRYLESVKPFLSDEEYQKTEAFAKEFAKHIGPQLHAGLLQQSQGKRNWLAEMWEDLAYLRSRHPLPTSTNWYGTDTVIESKRELKEPQVERMSRILYLALNYRQSILDQSLPTTKIRDTIPVCMHPYSRIFGTARIPGVEKDELVTAQDSNHIVVCINGNIFRMEVLDDDGDPLTEIELQQKIRLILEAAKEKGPNIGLLTTQNRTEWSKDREKLLEKNEKNVGCIESALLSFTLSDQEPDTLQDLSEDAFKGYNDRWFDKAIQYVIYKNGKFSGNIEHTWADATIAAAMQDHIFEHENDEIDVVECLRPIRKPHCLKWELDDKLEGRIEVAEKNIAPLMQNIDMNILRFETFGKNFIKNQHMSPDAFVQMAIQLAYYRKYGKSVLTYETASTRLFYQGRTDTIRSVTMESKAFCEAMDSEELENEGKLKLLQAATAKHAKNSKDAATGKGSDRHLLALKVAAMMNPQLQGVEIPFFSDKAFNLPFTLATSQTPCPNSAGGGFAPLTEDGYGVSYHVRGDHVNFHITSYHHHNDTSSEGLAEHLKQALLDMQKLTQ